MLFSNDQIIGMLRGKAVTVSTMARTVILVLLTLSDLLRGAMSIESNEYFKKSMHLQLRSENAALNGHVISSGTTPSALSCSFRCLHQQSCLSINYNTETKRCDVNDAAGRTNPDDVKTEADSMLFEVWEELSNPCEEHECNFLETCQPTEESPTGYACVQNNCTDPGTPLYGHQSGGNQHGDTLTFSCDVGYTLDGASGIVCSNGLWSDPLPVCRSFADCAEVLAFGFTVDGIYYIKPAGVASPVEVFCDMTTEGGGWTVIQNRQNGMEDFDRGWQDYKDGFGVLGSAYWFGNDYIHYLTTQGNYVLRIEVSDYSGNDVWAKFDDFSIAGESSLYMMTIGNQVAGNEVDQMTYQNGAPFSTSDIDNDNNVDYHCAEVYESGWWFKQAMVQGYNVNCYLAALNKPIVQNCPGLKGPKYGVGLDGVHYCLRRTCMKVRA
ncbi:ficolin-2-like [Ptychodera flava]|uniref:ficolin-2-like n=1 Tax=Ptychodera flava TaxID=63121 RepID=UPI00396A6B5C